MPQQHVRFFKAKSRLGMINIPIHGTELNLGVEKGPDAVLTEDLLNQIPSAGVETFTFSLPEQIPESEYTKIIVRESEQLASLITTTLSPTEVQAVIGGDHSVTFASLLALLKRFPAEKVGYIQFDSHTDINTFSSSPTGNFHGMFLRPFLGAFDDAVISQAIPQLLPAQNLLYIGNIEPDPEETEFIRKNSIKVISGSDIEQNLNSQLEYLHEFIKRFDHLHISFDIDIFHRSLVTATGTPALDGLSRESVLPLLQMAAGHSSHSFDFVEVNPLKEGASETLILAHEVIKILTGSIENIPQLTKKLRKNIVNQTANVQL